MQKSSQNHPKIITKSSQNHTKIITKSYQNNQKIMPKSSQTCPTYIPKSSQNQPKINSNTLQNHLKSYKKSPNMFHRSQLIMSRRRHLNDLGWWGFRVTQRARWRGCRRPLDYYDYFWFLEIPKAERIQILAVECTPLTHSARKPLANTVRNLK